MVRKGRSRRLKLEAFWRAHLKAWRDSNLNQREYCELHGLPLKRFGNWRAEFKNEQTIVPERLLYRRGGGDQPRLSSRRREIHPPPKRRRRDYSDADKTRIIEEASRENASVSGVARKYGISASLMFQWRKQLGMGPAHRIVPVTISDTADGLADLAAVTSRPTTSRTPTKMEPTAPAIEIELAGGRRLRFARDTDPETIQRLVAALDGGAR
ncbi:MAG: transposase [Hyphomicrobium sp.]